MLARECYELLATAWDDQLVVCSLGATCTEWWRITQSDRAFYMNSSMGIASSFGLGLSLGLGDHPVWVLDSDGAMVMNFGALLTMAQYQPPNLTHFVLANGVYQAIGAYPVVNARRTSLPALAASLGIEQVVSLASLDEVKQWLDEEADATGYRLVELVVEPVPERMGLDIPYEGAEMKYRFGRHVERLTGRQVFGPHGY